jgi:hypothetical protein
MIFPLVVCLGGAILAIAVGAFIQRRLGQRDPPTQFRANIRKK